MFKLGLIIGGLALLSSTVQAAVCPQFFPAAQPPPVGKILCNKGYAIGYSIRSRTPLWAAEHLTDESIPQAIALHGRSSFTMDYRLPLSSQTGHSDYHDTAYVRGHLAPSGDQPDWPTRIQTYLYSNVVPQDAEMNSGPWNQIEQATRQAAIDDGDIYVITGPIFSATPDTQGPDKAPIPIALFKMIYDAMDGESTAIICQNDTPAQCRQVTPAYLQAILGFPPMPGLSTHEKTSPLTVEGWFKTIRRSQY